MAVVTREEIVNQINSLIEENSDGKIKLLEDITDTMSERTSDEDWKTKYEENDAAWRKKYVERFSGKTVEEVKEKPTEEVKTYETYDDLFEEVK